MNIYKYNMINNSQIIHNNSNKNTANLILQWTTSCWCYNIVLLIINLIVLSWPWTQSCCFSKVCYNYEDHQTSLMVLSPAFFLYKTGSRQNKPFDLCVSMIMGCVLMTLIKTHWDMGSSICNTGHSIQSTAWISHRFLLYEHQYTSCSTTAILITYNQENQKL